MLNYLNVKSVKSVDISDFRCRGLRQKKNRVILSQVKST